MTSGSPNPGETDSRSLADALRDYVEARTAAMLVARKALDIGELDARALLYIVERPEARPGDLRSYLGITSAGVTTLTDRLVERGVVRRDSDTADRRMVRLTATVDLEDAPWNALGRFDSEYARAIGAADPSRAEDAARLLDELTRGMRAVA